MTAERITIRIRKVGDGRWVSLREDSGVSVEAPDEPKAVVKAYAMAHGPQSFVIVIHHEDETITREEVG